MKTFLQHCDRIERFRAKTTKEKYSTKMVVTRKATKSSTFLLKCRIEDVEKWAFGLTVEVEQPAERKEADGARVNAEADRAGVAEVGRSFLRAAVVLVERATRQHLLPVHADGLGAHDPSEHPPEVRMLGVDLSGVVVTLRLENDQQVSDFNSQHFSTRWSTTQRC